MEKAKYILALWLAHLYIFLIIALILGVLTLPFHLVETQPFAFFIIIGIFSFIGTLYLFKKEVVYIYPSNGTDEEYKRKKDKKT